MFFTILNNLYEPYSSKKESIKQVAYARIHFYKLTTNDKLLSAFLKKEYKKSLKVICKNLVYHKLNINIDNLTQNMIITFKDIQSDKLASLITYGNEYVLGSNILRKALDQNY
jgi:hypothetical protein